MDMNSISVIGLRAVDVVNLVRGGAVLMVYQNQVVGQVVPVDSPIAGERGSGKEGIRKAWLDHLSIVEPGLDG